MMTLRDGRFAALALGTALFALAGLPAVAGSPQAISTVDGSMFSLM